MQKKDPQTIVLEFLKQHGHSKTDEHYHLKKYIHESTEKLDKSYADHKKVYQMILELKQKINMITYLKPPALFEKNNMEIIPAVQTLVARYTQNALAHNMVCSEEKIVLEALVYLLTGKMYSLKTIEKEPSRFDFAKLIEKLNIEDFDSETIENLKADYLNSESWISCVQNPDLHPNLFEVMNWIVGQVNNYTYKAINGTYTSHLVYLKNNFEQTQQKTALFENQIVYYQAILNYANFKLHQIEIELSFQMPKSNTSIQLPTEQNETVLLNYSIDNSPSVIEEIGKSINPSQLSKITDKKELMNADEISHLKSSGNNNSLLMYSTFGKNGPALEYIPNGFEIITSPGKKSEQGMSFDFNFDAQLKASSKFQEFANLTLMTSQQDKKNHSAFIKKSDESFLEFDRLLAKNISGKDHPLKRSSGDHSDGSSSKNLPQSYKGPSKGKKGSKPTLEINSHEQYPFEFPNFDTKISPIHKGNSPIEIKPWKGNRSKSVVANISEKPAEDKKNIQDEKESEHDSKMFQFSVKDSQFSEYNRDIMKIPTSIEQYESNKIFPTSLSQYESNKIFPTHETQIENKTSLSTNREKTSKKPTASKSRKRKSENFKKSPSVNMQSDDVGSIEAKSPTIQQVANLNEHEFSINDDYSHYLSVLEKANKLIIENQERLSQSFMRDDEGHISTSVFMNGSFNNNPKSVFVEKSRILDETEREESKYESSSSKNAPPPQNQNCQALPEKQFMNFNLNLAPKDSIFGKYNINLVSKINEQKKSTPRESPRESTVGRSPTFEQSQQQRKTLEFSDTMRDIELLGKITHPQPEQTDIVKKDTIRNFQKQIDTKPIQIVIDQTTPVSELAETKKKLYFRGLEWKNAIPQTSNVAKKNKTSYQESKVSTNKINFVSDRFNNFDQEPEVKKTKPEKDIHNESQSSIVTPRLMGSSVKLSHSMIMNTDESFKNLSTQSTSSLQVLKKKVINGRELYCIKVINEKEIYVYKEDLKSYGYEADPTI